MAAITIPSMLTDGHLSGTGRYLSRPYAPSAVLHVHRADRADRLIGALSGVLAVPAADPLAAEIVAVPTRGVERWLTQQLSTRLGVGGAQSRDGVCANVV